MLMMKPKKLILILAGALFAATLMPAQADEARSEKSEQQEGAAYTPGLGDMMGAIQVRHAKLWFAGINGDWPLAEYELDELKEGLDDAVRYNPEFKGIPVKLLLSQFTAKPLSELEASIKERNSGAFTNSFDHLTSACNGCHTAAEHSFISIKRPTSLPVTNQRFLPQGG